MVTKYEQKGKPKDFTGGDFYKKSRSKKMMGGSMVDQMQGQMKKKMAKPRGGYAHGGKAMGGKADIAAMEKLLAWSKNNGNI
jgi:hypothetical protein